MCGRYSLSAPGDVIAEIFALARVPDLRPRWNIAPTQDAPVVRAAPDGSRHVDLLRWGLVPFWAKEASIGNRMINARSETAHEKASFKHPLRKRRCLVPVDGFYEWQQTPDGKVPTRIQRRDGRPFALAGLWERWSRGPGEPLETFTILTTSPNALLKPVHDRMPVVLDAADWPLWLDPGEQDPARLAPLLVACPDDALEAFAVSRRVNSPAHDDAECAAPV
jgi:putative SOS response-associated peptidase YedK